VYFFAARLLVKYEIDDVVGAVPVHCFCGIWGVLAAGKPLEFVAPCFCSLLAAPC